MRRSRSRFPLLLLILLAIAAVVVYQSTPPAPKPEPVSTNVVARTGAAALYPPAETPGAVDPAVTQDNIYDTICRRGYTRTVRPPERYTHRIKQERMAEEHLAGRLADYELDHMVPLELGGCPDCEANLWMEPWPDAREKDRVENYLHREVCDGRIPLADAQQMIMRDWYAVLPRAAAGGR